MTLPRLAQLHQSEATDGQVVTWDDALGMWVPADPTGGGAYTDPLTTKGDLVGRSSSATSRVPVGTNGYALVADSAQTFGVAWADLSGLYVPKSLVDAKGDLLTATANDTPARLAVGSNGQVLSADSAETTGLKWIAALSDPSTTKGDLLVRGASALVRRAVGTDGEVLTADSTQSDGVKWAAIPGGAASVDDVPASPDAWDYEFDATTSSLPSGWTWLNQGTSTYDERAGRGTLFIPDSATYNRVIRKAVPSGSTWTVMAKFSVLTYNSSLWNMGFVWRDSSTGRLFNFVVDQRWVGWSKWSATSTFNSEANGSGGKGPLIGDQFYMRAIKNSSTSYDLAWSRDGIIWLTVHTALNGPSYVGTPDEFGIVCNAEMGGTSGTHAMSCHWIRKTA